MQSLKNDILIMFRGSFSCLDHRRAREMLLKMGLGLILVYCAFNLYTNPKPTINRLFVDLIDKFERQPQSHILKVVNPINTGVDIGAEYRFYSAYGVYFPKEFKIHAHRDYQCSLCNGDFKAIMIPKYIHPDMAQVCFENGCENATKGYYLVDVCKDHWTKPGTLDRIQINIYYTNSTRCKSLGQLDEFDCEAENFGLIGQYPCTTTHPFLAPLVQQRDLHWHD